MGWRSLLVDIVFDLKGDGYSMKKLISLLLGLVVVLYGAIALADNEGTCGANLTWKLDSAGVLTISGSGPMQDCKYGSAPWDDLKNDIKSLIIEDGVTSIGDSAFSWCRELTNVTLPDTLTVIGNRAFENCEDITTVKMSKSVESIGSWAFYGCDNLISIELPDTLKRIENLAFHDCKSLTVLNIPSSVEYINEDRTFAGSKKLTAINVAEENANYKSVNGVLYNKDQTTLLVYPAGKTERSFTIPETVTRVIGYAFYWNPIIESISVPESVETIGEDAFAGCSKLTSIHLSEGLISIGDTAFHQCNTLPSITFPASLQQVGTDMFESCYALKEILVAEGSETFKSVDGVLFDVAGKTLIAYPIGKVQGIYNIPDGVETVGNYAFLYARNLVNVTFPNSLITIGSGAFSGCDKITGIELPESLITIDDYAFRSCESITSITIPANVTSIGGSAFSWCDKLLNVTIMGQYTSFDKYGVFDYCDDGLTIKGLAGSTAEQMAKDEEFNFEAVTFENENSQSGSDNWSCPECKTINHGGKFCSECGTKRPESQVCSNCGYENADLDNPFKFCPECGTKYE